MQNVLVMRPAVRRAFRHTLRQDVEPAAPPGTAWVTYVRCHDDVGWAVTDEDAAAVGEDGRLDRRFLVDFYAGAYPGSFARGAPFQEDRVRGDLVRFSRRRAGHGMVVLANFTSAPQRVHATVPEVHGGEIVADRHPLALDDDAGRP